MENNEQTVLNAWAASVVKHLTIKELEAIKQQMQDHIRKGN